MKRKQTILDFFKKPKKIKVKRISDAKVNKKLVTLTKDGHWYPVPPELIAYVFDYSDGCTIFGSLYELMPEYVEEYRKKCGKILLRPDCGCTMYEPSATKRKRWNKLYVKAFCNLGSDIEHPNIPGVFADQLYVDHIPPFGIEYVKALETHHDITLSSNDYEHKIIKIACMSDPETCKYILKKIDESEPHSKRRIYEHDVKFNHSGSLPNTQSFSYVLIHSSHKYITKHILIPLLYPPDRSSVITPTLVKRILTYINVEELDWYEKETLLACTFGQLFKYCHKKLGMSSNFEDMPKTTQHNIMTNTTWHGDGVLDWETANVYLSIFGKPYMLAVCKHYVNKPHTLINFLKKQTTLEWDDMKHVDFPLKPFHVVRTKYSVTLNNMIKTQFVPTTQHVDKLRWLKSRGAILTDDDITTFALTFATEYNYEGMLFLSKDCKVEHMNDRPQVIQAIKECDRFPSFKYYCSKLFYIPYTQIGLWYQIRQKCTGAYLDCIDDANY